MAYGQIHQDLVTAAGANSDVAHNLGNTNFCVFTTQDRTGAGAAQNATPRVYCASKDQGGLHTTIRMTNPGGAGNLAYDITMFAAHSLVDVGPVMTGATPNTRTAADVWNSKPTRPSYRSLHAAVVVARTGAPSVTVTITHLLNTTSVMVIASPLGDPFNNGAMVRYYLDAVTSTQANVVFVLEGGGNFDAYNSTWDVMVVAMPAIGHSVPYLGGGDYGIAGPTALARRASYWTGYTNVDIPGIGVLNLVHDLNAAASTALFGFHVGSIVAGNPPFLGTRTSGTPLTAITLSDIAGTGVDDLDVLVLRPHSIICDPVLS